MKILWVLTVVGGVLWNATASWSAEPLRDSLEKGLLEEEANQNLNGAIQAYQAVLDRFAEERRIAATATFRLGECYRKQGKTNEAFAEFQRVVREFGDQPQLAQLSRRYLARYGMLPRPEHQPIPSRFIASLAG